MKYFVKFDFTIYGYSSRDFNSDEMAILGAFFTTDYDLFGIETLIKWVKDPSQCYTNANLSYLEKENGIVSIGDLYDEEPIITFDLSEKQFIELIESWEALVAQRPKEIIITRNNDQIKLEGRN